MNQIKILVVDDEPDLCNILKFNLEAKGYNVDVAYSAEEGLNKDLDSYSLVLLDVMMNEISGCEMLSIIRNERNCRTPVIFITAMNTESDVLQGFKMGADDYIKKPFSINEVLVRVNAVISRSKVSKYKMEYNKGLNLDSSRKRIFIDKSPVDFTKTEYDIFTLLYTQPGKVYSRDEILKRIWSDQEYVLGRTVDVNITRIRKKLGNWGKCIATRSGYGYYFDDRKTQ
jgi:DNA-binding response OmpR family regulator